MRFFQGTRNPQDRASEDEGLLHRCTLKDDSRKPSWQPHGQASRGNEMPFLCSGDPANGDRHSHDTASASFSVVSTTAVLSLGLMSKTHQDRLVTMHTETLYRRKCGARPIQTEALGLGPCSLHLF